MNSSSSSSSLDNDDVFESSDSSIIQINSDNICSDNCVHNNQKQNGDGHNGPILSSTIVTTTTMTTTTTTTTSSASLSSTSSMTTISSTESSSMSMNKQQQQSPQQIQRLLPPLTCEYGSIYGSTIFSDSFFSQNELERFFPDHKIRLSIITWNMASKPPPDYNESLKQLLQLNNDLLKLSQKQNNLPELFVIGLQETPTSEMILNNLKVGLQAALGPNYCLLRWSSVGVLHCSIWMRRELLWSCTTVTTIPIHMRPQAANRIRTKGAITLSFTLFGTSFIFINTHLTAHEINLRSRMNQLDKVKQTLNLKYPSKSESNLYVNSTTTTTNNNNNIRDHNSEFIFWFGDLNFRLELPHEIVIDAIRHITTTNNDETKDIYLRKMLHSDQLTNLINRGIIFNGFEEALWPPPFLPTYKCKINHKPIVQSSSQSIDDLFINFYNYESGRVPSYTDRILYQTKQQSNNDKNDSIKCLYYNSIINLNSSDHKPVYALFELYLDSSSNNLNNLNNDKNMKQLNQMVDEFYLNNVSDVGKINDKINQQQNQKEKDEPPPNSSNSSKSDSTLTTMNKSNHFCRLVDHVVNNRKNKIINQDGFINDNNPSDSNNEQQSINSNNQKEWSKLNAGAYDRKIYMEGMRLRNNLWHSTSIDEMRLITNTQSIVTINQQQQQSSNSNNSNERVKNKIKQNQKPILFKSHSLESNLIINNYESGDKSNNEIVVTNSKSRICSIM